MSQTQDHDDKARQEKQDLHVEHRNEHEEHGQSLDARTVEEDRRCTEPGPHNNGNGTRTSNDKEGAKGVSRNTLHKVGSREYCQNAKQCIQ